MLSNFFLCKRQIDSTNDSVIRHTFYIKRIERAGDFIGNEQMEEHQFATQNLHAF